MIMQQLGDRALPHTTDDVLGRLREHAARGRDAQAAIDAVVADPSITLYVSIGNSDDKLPQDQWSTFCQVIDNVVRRRATAVHGVWYSLPNAGWQNACWCFEIRPVSLDDLRERLARAAADFGQDSIALAKAFTEFIRPVV